MRKLAILTTPLLAAGLLLGLTAGVAQADPKPDNPNWKKTTRTVACEWTDPGTNREKFSKITVKFKRQSDGQVVAESYSIRGKSSKSHIGFGIADPANIDLGREYVLVGALDSKGRAKGLFNWYDPEGTFVIRLVEVTESQLWPPSEWLPQVSLCETTMSIPQ